MMNRYFIVARGSTCPREKAFDAQSFEELRRANYQRDDEERQHWTFGHAPARPEQQPTWDRTRYVNPAE